ncbi:MAG TPA: hypothetical protein VK826_00370 [Bacteroidia bacterium]|nr:hypothetical protein [Bacteroidia bacterium]
MTLSRKKKKTDKLLDDLDQSTTKALRMLLELDTPPVKKVKKVRKGTKAFKKLAPRVRAKKTVKSPKKVKSTAKK